MSNFELIPNESQTDIIKNSEELLSIEPVKNGLLYRGVSTLEAARMLNKSTVTQSFSDWARIDYQIPKQDHIYYWLPNIENLSQDTNTSILHAQMIEGNPNSDSIYFTTSNFLKSVMSYACGLSINDYFKYLTGNSAISKELNFTREDIIKFILMSGKPLNLIPRNDILNRIILDVEAETKDTYPFLFAGYSVTDEIIKDYPELKIYKNLINTFGDQVFEKLQQSLYSRGCVLVGGKEVMQNSHRVIAANFEPGEIITTSENPLEISALKAIIPLSKYDAELLKRYSNY
jgi:hypothetical protein